MPSKSAKQAHLMAAVAHNPEFAKKVGIPMTVGKEFNQADKGHKFKKGGVMGLFKGTEKPAEEKAEAKALRSGKISKADYIKGEKSEGHKEPMSEVKKNANDIKSGKLSPAAYAAEEGKEYKKGGEVMGPRTMSKDVEKGSDKLTKFGQSAVQKRGETKGKNMGDSGKKAGIQSGRGNGIAQRGLTKGKVV